LFQANGSSTSGVSRLSIQKADNKPFNFKSIYVYVVGSRQKIKFTAFRAGSDVAGLSQTFDLLMGTNPDVTFSPSNWNDIDELRITNNGAHLLRMEQGISMISRLIWIILRMNYLRL